MPVNYTFINVTANHTVSANFTELIIDARPQAKFDADPRSGIAPLNVQFSQVLVSNNTGLLWSFGDNTTSTDQNPNHTYSDPGNYNVSLTIFCDNESFTEEQQHFISVLPNLPPIGGNKGFFLVHSNVDGASVFFDNDFKGNITNGTLNVSVFLTATPYRTFTVKKSGYSDFVGFITKYPGKGETLDLFATLVPSGFVNFDFQFVDFPALKFVEPPLSFHPFNFTFIS